MGQSRPRLHLHTFAGLSVSRDDAPATGAAQQRMTLALLALLAGAGRRGMSRDKIVAYLWPDSDTERARGLLKQACYALRRDLEEPELFLGATELRLNADVIAVDVVLFEAAVDAGDLAQAAELYAGAFLDGFYLGDSVEFDQWVELQRDRLHRRAADVFGSLVPREDDARIALELGHRLFAADPVNSRVAAALMQRLAEAGDRPAALQIARVHEQALSKELGTAPDAVVLQLANHLRTQDPPADPATAAVILGQLSNPHAHVMDVAGAAPAHRARRVPFRLSTTIGLTALVVAVGGWFAFGRGLARGGNDAPSVAVLPFTNLGDPDDQYFAEGITEEITARLAANDGLRVTATTSAASYKGAKKDVRTIGSELGVDYLLEGSIRWEKTGAQEARVRITPQLVSTRDGAHVWADIYDEQYDAIFRIQSEIAAKVENALHVRLVASRRGTAQSRPTKNLEAYEHYLRGLTYHRRSGDERSTRAAMHSFEQAIALDSAFTLAYAMLARSYTRMIAGRFEPQIDYRRKTRWALDRALALDSTLAEVHHSVGAYHMEEMNYDVALRELTVAVRLGERMALHPRAVLHMRLGHMREALADYATIWRLDPRSSGLASNYAFCAAFARQYSLADSLYDRAIALSPESYAPYQSKAELYMRWFGRTDKVRAVFEQARAVGVAEEPTMQLLQIRTDMFDRRYGDALDKAARAPKVMQGRFHFTPRAQMQALVYSLTGDVDVARAHYDSARQAAEAAISQLPNEARIHSALGIAYAGLGRKKEAIVAGKRAVELLPMSRFAPQGYEREVDLARIYAMVGEADSAIARLEHLLSIPGSLTPQFLGMDQKWNPLRDNPRFQRLVNGRR